MSFSSKFPWQFLPSNNFIFSYFTLSSTLLLYFLLQVSNNQPIKKQFVPCCTKLFSFCTETWGIQKLYRCFFSIQKQRYDLCMPHVFNSLSQPNEDIKILNTIQISLSLIFSGPETTRKASPIIGKVLSHGEQDFLKKYFIYFHVYLSLTVSERAKGIWVKISEVWIYIEGLTQPVELL